MADPVSVLFGLVGFALHLGSQLVSFLCTLLSVNHELITAALQALLNIAETLQSIIHAVTFALVDVVFYVLEVASRLFHFTSRLCNGATTIFEAAWEISQLLFHSGYTVAVFAVSTTKTFVSGAVFTAENLFRMLMDSTPMLMAKCADLYHDFFNAGQGIFQEWTRIAVVAAQQADNMYNQSWSTIFEVVDQLLAPFVALRNFFIVGVAGTVFKYQFEIFLVFFSLCLSCVILMSYSSISFFCYCFLRFLNRFVHVIGSLLGNLVPQLSRITNTDIDHRDMERDERDENRDSDNQSEHDDHADSQSEHYDSDNESVQHHPGVLADWLELHEPNRVNAPPRTVNTFGIYNDEESIPMPGPSGYNLRSRSQTPDRATAGGKLKNLKRELEEEKDKHLCVICQDNEKNILLLPCKHMCMCDDCADEVLHNEYVDRRVCPLCRARITKAIDVYL